MKNFIKGSAAVVGVGAIVTAVVHVLRKRKNSK